MNIEIQGLTAKQVALCDIMWAISTKDGVESFIRTLPKTDQRDCRTKLYKTTSPLRRAFL
jgi:hypothetical protein